jgi:hypothetical protein
MYYLAREYRMHVVESAIALDAIVDPTLENIQTLMIKPSGMTTTKEVDSDEELFSYGRPSYKRKLFIDLVVGLDTDPSQFPKRPRLDSLMSLSPQSSHSSDETIPHDQDEYLDPNVFTD